MVYVDFLTNKIDFSGAIPDIATDCTFALGYIYFSLRNSGMSQEKAENFLETILARAIEVAEPEL